MTEPKRRMADHLTADEERAIRAEVPANLRNIRAVLIETREPGNIGSVARALKGMGMSDLRLVNPLCDWSNSPRTRRFAVNSKEVLRTTVETKTLDEALERTHFVVGTTNRRRMHRLMQPLPAREAAEEIARISQEHRVAVLYGREDFGLSSEDLARCDRIVSIPMATKNPSLNLAQAVQVFSYELFVASVTNVESYPHRLAERADVDALVHRVTELLKRVDFRPMNDDWATIREPIQRVVGRVPLEKRDLQVLMKICHDIESYLDRRTSPANP